MSQSRIPATSNESRTLRETGKARPGWRQQARDQHPESRAALEEQTPQRFSYTKQGRFRPGPFSDSPFHSATFSLSAAQREMTGWR